MLLSFTLALVILYYLVSPHYESTRQKSWVLTAISSFIMICFSLPFFGDYVAGGWTVHAVRTSTIYANLSCVFFQAYLVADLALGVLNYRQQINLLSGWVHHFLYIFVVDFATRRSLAHVFSLCACMELPTFIMALGTLYPRLRSDLLFATSFFLTRIILHIVFLVSYAMSSNRHELLAGSFVPSGILTCAFFMHTLWFTKCVKGNLRRLRLKRDRELKSTGMSETANVKKTRLCSSTSESVLLQSTQAVQHFRHPPLPSTTSHSIGTTLLSNTIMTASSQPWPFIRRDSFDRALQTFQAVHSARIEVYRAVHKIQQSDRFRRFQRTRQNVYDRIPDRQILFDYVGLNPRGRAVTVQ